MSPVFETLAANGATTLATLAIAKLYKKHSLSIKMRVALERAGEDTPENTLVRDLQQAFGAHGALTQVTNRSLLDIANSGLLEHLVPLFGSDLDPSDALQLVSYIHLSRGGSNDDDSNQFAKALATCLQVAYQSIHSTVMQSSSPSEQKRLRRTLNEDAKRAGSVFAVLVSSLRDRKGRWLTDEDIEPEELSKRIANQTDPLLKYVKATVDKLQSVDVHGAAGDVLKVDLDDIYVDMPISMIPRRKSFTRYQDLRTHISRRVIAGNWKGALEHISKTVLLGDPGGGKSTLSKKLCYEYAKRFQEGHSTLPIFIQLRMYIAKAAEDEHYTLARYVLEHVESTQIDDDDEPLRTTVLYYLRIGSAFVVADGLDEVLTPSNRARVVQEIMGFSRAFPLAAMLVTSRYVGYETNPLNGFSHLGVSHLNRNAIATIYNNVSGAVLDKTEVEINEGRGSFLADAHKKARELIRNPLLLTLIVIIYNKKSEIPDNRAALYSFCADLLFERWDRYRNIKPDLPERYRLFDLFKHLSALLYEREEYGGRINKSDLFDEAREFFRRDYVDNREGKSASAAYHMVEHLTGRAWILHEVGEDVFEFTHRTFMEFFYARHLETVHESTEALIGECLRHVVEGSRTVPAHLALQIRTKDKRAASSKICESLTGALLDEDCSDELIDFCLDALGYILPEGAAIAKFVDELAPKTLKMNSRVAPVKLLCTSSPLRDAILQSTLPAIRNVSSVDEVRRMAPALYQMYSNGNVLVEMGEEGSANICQMVVQQTWTKQTRSPFLCKLAFDLDCQVNWKALRKFGFRVWSGERSHGFYQLMRDSITMVEEVSKVLAGREERANRYYRLAKILYWHFLKQKIGVESDVHLMHHVLYSPNTREARISFEPKGLPAAQDVLELFAFSLALFLELNGEDANSKQLKRYGEVMESVVRSLVEGCSSKGLWFKGWMAGDRSILVDSRFLGWRGDIFTKK